MDANDVPVRQPHRVALADDGLAAAAIPRSADELDRHPLALPLAQGDRAEAALAEDPHPAAADPRRVRPRRERGREVLVAAAAAAAPAVKAVSQDLPPTGTVAHAQGAHRGAGGGVVAGGSIRILVSLFVINSDAI